jgi:hypothetical protein
MTAQLEAVDYAELLRNPKELSLIGSGGYGNVYRLAPGIVVKTGHIWDDEVEIQSYFLSQEAAVPIYYVGTANETGPLHNRYCYGHDANSVGEKCERGHVQVIMMAEANPIPDWRAASVEVENFMDYIQQLTREKFGREWDWCSRHVMEYEGHLVAVDFGYWDS